MKIQLTPSYELTNEHSASSYGRPVLVNRGSGEAYGPGDIVRAYPSWLREVFPIERRIDDHHRFQYRLKRPLVRILSRGAK